MAIRIYFTEIYKTSSDLYVQYTAQLLMVKIKWTTFTLSKLCIGLRKTQRFTGYSISYIRRYCSLGTQQQTEHQVIVPRQWIRRKNYQNFIYYKLFYSNLYLHLKDEPHFFWSVYLKSSSYIKSVDSIKLNSIERQVSIERWVFPSTKKSLRKTEALTKHKMWTFRSTTAINLLKGSINELSFVVALNLAIKLSGFEINLYDIVISPLLYTYQAWIRLYSCWQGDLWRCQVLQLYGFQPEELPWLLIGLALGRFLSIIFGRKRWHSCAYTWKFENQNC